MTAIYDIINYVTIQHWSFL